MEENVLSTEATDAQDELDKSSDGTTEGGRRVAPARRRIAPARRAQPSPVGVRRAVTSPHLPGGVDPNQDQDTSSPREIVHTEKPQDTEPSQPTQLNEEPSDLPSNFHNSKSDSSIIATATLAKREKKLSVKIELPPPPGGIPPPPTPGKEESPHVHLIPLDEAAKFVRSNLPSSGSSSNLGDDHQQGYSSDYGSSGSVIRDARILKKRDDAENTSPFRTYKRLLQLVIDSMNLDTITRARIEEAINTSEAMKELRKKKIISPKDEKTLRSLIHMLRPLLSQFDLSDSDPSVSSDRLSADMKEAGAADSDSFADNQHVEEASEEVFTD